MKLNLVKELSIFEPKEASTEVTEDNLEFLQDFFSEEEISEIKYDADGREYRLELVVKRKLVNGI